jgi:multicomponent Na+:H+ antiporter subunit D
VLAQTQLLFFSALAFVWLNLRGMYPPELKSTHLDFDWTYRRFLPLVLRRCFATIWKIDAAIRHMFLSRLDSGLNYLAQRNVGASNLLSRNHPAGSMVIWVAVLLSIYLLLGFSRNYL